MSDLDEGLPVDMEGRESLVGKFNSVEELAKSYHSLSKKMGESTRVPNPDAGEEEWSGFYQSLGAPSSSEGYEIPEGINEDLSGTLKSARKAALDKGVTREQWNEMLKPVVNLENDRLVASEELQKKSVENWKQQAQEKYGTNYEAKAALAERAYKNIIQNNPELDKVFKVTGMGHHPEVMDFMIRMGMNMSDDAIPTSVGSNNLGGDNPASLAARARKLAKLGAIQNPRHPDYEEHYTEFMTIQKQLMEDGFEGMNDKRLMPSTSWIRGRSG